MALRVKKLRFPKELATIDFNLCLDKEGISEEGEPIKALEKSGKCIFSEKSKVVIDSDGKKIILFGKVAIENDIAPELKTISSGKITINDKTYTIYAGYRPRNPDGSVFCTEFDLM